MNTFKIDGQAADFRVVRFEGHEAISDLYAFQIVVFAQDHELDFEAIVGEKATLTLVHGDATRYVSGIIAAFEETDAGTKAATYVATLVPSAWKLEHRRDSRIFQNMTTKDIVSKVVDGGGGGELRWSLIGSYEPREYCVQYRESDWSFVCRLLEEEGIHYWFEHDDGSHVLVLADAPAAHSPLPGGAALPFHPDRGALVKGEHVATFRFRMGLRSGKVALTDYDFKKPTVSLLASSDGERDTTLEVYDFPGEYDAAGAGSGIAKIRLQELQSSRRTGDGASNCSRIAPGYTFELGDHHRESFNRSYLVMRVHHEGFDPRLVERPEGDRPAALDEVYSNRFEVIPDDAPYRPARVTPWPTIKGVQTAIVVGPAGEEIYTDEHGRIKVQFHWDREGKRDENSSCWMRVSQIWAGSGWGAVFIPRIGHEVVVDFLEGDPDRPLVVGSVYHGTNVPAVALPGDKTRSTIKSNSSPRGGGFNELRFEDKKGSEEVFLQAEKDWNTLVKNDRSIDVLHDNTEKVGNNEEVLVAANRNLTVGANHTLTVSGNQAMEVGKNLDTTVGENLSLAVTQNKSETVSGSSSESVTKSKTSRVDEEFSLTVGKDMTLTVSKNLKEELKGERTTIVGKKLSIQVGDANIVIEKNGNIKVAGKKITVKAEGDVEVEGKKLTVKSEGAVNVEASGKVVVKGSQVGVN